MMPMSAEAEQYMRRALELARLGRGQAEPNPMVGAVIVRHGRMIGEGYHQRFGGPHAEIEAIAAARSAGETTAGATLYVTLEPCCHHGKTPPCTDAVIAAGFARVVAAMQDPDAKVGGKGFAALRQAGIEVAVGVCESQARELLAAYIKLRTTGRCWVICKWAQTLDGKIATAAGQSKWITGPAARARVHELRGQCAGICVGAGTVRADDPLLTNRGAGGKQPARVVLAATANIPLSCQLLQTARQSPVIVAAGADAPPERVEAIRATGAEVLPLPMVEGGVSLAALLDELGRRQWTHLLVEGGRAVLGAFLRQKLADELLVFIAPKLLGGAASLGPVDWPDVHAIEEGLALPTPAVEPIGPDLLLRYVMGQGSSAQPTESGNRP
jgi:diaminohydroxyphosphoribosylaminopyrimidine deaminase/5-amino-6-(5-phosphoribosylamino)uracil reductase